MSLEIREMILRTTLVENNIDSSRKNKTETMQEPEIDVDYIIAECMERLREWIREENER